MIDLNEIKKKLQEKLKKDPNIANLGLAEDFLNFDSFVPFGISTGLPQLDLNLQRLGYPAGKIIEIYGFERSGKSALALAAVAECQRQGGSAIWIEAESTFDWDRARRAGIDNTKLLLIEANSIEAIFRLIETSALAMEKADKNSPVLYVVDSITAAASETELGEKFYENKEIFKAEGRMGNEAKAIRRGLKRINSILPKISASVIFINHAIATMASFGNAKQAAGGHALKFFASLRVCLTHFKQLKTEDKSTYLGQEIQINFEKYKGAAEKQNKITELLTDGIFDRNNSLFEAMLGTKLLTQAGHSYELTFDDELFKFKKEDWPAIIDQCGGFKELYTNVINLWIEKGLAQPWGV